MKMAMKLERFGVKNVRLAMLTKGDVYNLNSKAITFSEKKNLRVKKRPAITNNDLFSTTNTRNFFAVTTELFRDTDSESSYGVSAQDRPQFRFDFVKTENSEIKGGKINGVTYLGYKNLYIHVYCSKNC